MAPLLTKIERLCLALRVSCLVPWVLFAVLDTAITALTYGLPFQMYLICAILNVLMKNLEAQDIQYLCYPTRDVYTKWVYNKVVRASGTQPISPRLTWDVECLADKKSSLLWVGDRRKAKKVVLFFHGGGYVTPLLSGHLDWCWRTFVIPGIETGTEVAVAVLDYTLYPEARYPVQLCQAADALSHLLASGFESQDIIIGGDSAGGGLACQLLCHLAHPYPGAVSIHLINPLAATFLVSPWLTRRTDDQSFAENGSIDMLSAAAVEKFTSDLFDDDITTTKKRCLEFPLDLETPFFDKINAITRQLFVTVGYYEVFREQCIAFVDQVRHLNPDLKLHFDIQEQMAHDFIVLEGLRGQTGKCTEQMRMWMRKLLEETVE